MAVAEVSADISGLLNLAGRLADAARPVVLEKFRSGISHEAKGDESPVTEADRAAEALMRQMINAERPSDGIFGEEYGVERPDADVVWILDPIDGTKSFVTGKPVFSTLIGIVHQNRAIAGVMDIPGLGERWAGGEGLPTTLNGAPIETRKGVALSDAWLTCTSPDMFDDVAFPKFKRLSDAARYTVYGSDGFGYGQLAAGWVDLVCEDTLAPYDYAALIPIIEGAGGVITDWDGEALSFSADGPGKDRSVIAAGDAALHGEALRALAHT